MTKFKSSATGVVYVPGHSVISVEAGKQVKSDDEVVVAALSANPDFEEVKSQKDDDAKDYARKG